MSNAPTLQRLAGKLQPTQNGSTYVDPEQLEWQPTGSVAISRC